MADITYVRLPIEFIYLAVLPEAFSRLMIDWALGHYGNATAESFMKTLKYEEVYRQAYCDLAEVHGSIHQLFELVYNEKRLHSAPGYLPPEVFEQTLVPVSAQTAESVGTAALEFTP